MPSQHKRKRTSSALSISIEDEAAARIAALPPESINPLSHPPSVLRQLKLAGLSERETLPSQRIPDFPHRAWTRTPKPRGRRPSRQRSGAADASSSRHSSSHASDTALSSDGHGDASDTELPRPGAVKRRPGPPRTQERRLAVLAAIVKRGLRDGDLARARRAFALLMRADVAGKPVDLRHNGYWALGAEVLMREGEPPPSRGRGGEAEAEDSDGGGGGGGGGMHGTEPAGQQHPPRRWGTAANMPRVRAYFEGLIHQHPFTRMRPDATSALDFWPVLLGCEVYNIYAEQSLALWRVRQREEEQRAAEGGEEDDEYDEDERADASGSQAQALLLRTPRRRRSADGSTWERDRIRREALGELRAVATRMDGLMSAVPFSTHAELLRLRGLVALYMGDLAVPARLVVDDAAAQDENEGRAQRASERKRAARLFRQMIEHGGQPDEMVTQLLRQVDEEDLDMGVEYGGGSGVPMAQLSPMFSSLPIRLTSDFSP